MVYISKRYCYTRSMATTASYRETKYCNAIRNVIGKLGHATNNDILTALRHEFPDLSATTVHRATARLAGRDEIGIAPSNKQGATRYDTLARPHDHFNCNVCDRLCDANLRDKILPIIENTVKDCSISGVVVVTGICRNCSYEA